MYRPLQKLAFICNICFWITVVFQLTEKARLIPEPVLNTIVILGISAVLVNVLTLAATWYFYKKKPGTIKLGGFINRAIAISAVLQIGYLFLIVFR